MRASEFLTSVSGWACQIFMFCFENLCKIRFITYTIVSFINFGWINSAGKMIRGNWAESCAPINNEIILIKLGSRESARLYNFNYCVNWFGKPWNLIYADRYCKRFARICVLRLDIVRKRYKISRFAGFAGGSDRSEIFRFVYFSCWREGFFSKQSTGTTPRSDAFGFASASAAERSGENRLVRNARRGSRHWLPGSRRSLPQCFRDVAASAGFVRAIFEFSEQQVRPCRKLGFYRG